VGAETLQTTAGYRVVLAVPVVIFPTDLSLLVLGRLLEHIQLRLEPVALLALTPLQKVATLYLAVQMSLHKLLMVVEPVVTLVVPLVLSTTADLVAVAVPIYLSITVAVVCIRDQLTLMPHVKVMTVVVEVVSMDMGVVVEVQVVQVVQARAVRV
jgi:hypothetical protein